MTDASAVLFVIVFMSIYLLLAIPIVVLGLYMLRALIRFLKS
jgi:hypothetical protein